MRFLNPDNHSCYECTNPIRLDRGKLPLDSEKVYTETFSHYSKRTGDSIYKVSSTYKNYKLTPIWVPCRKCDNCRRLIQRQWQSRLSHHSYYVSQRCNNSHIYFVTLSFDDDHLPEHKENSNSVEIASYSLVQSFVRSLRLGSLGVYRKAGRLGTSSFQYDFFVPFTFDYFVVGEFGDSQLGNHRFHYHLILFFKDDSQVPDYFLHDKNGRTINKVDEFLYGRKRYRPSLANPLGLDLKLTYINSGVHSSIKKKTRKRLQTGKEATLQYILSQHWNQGIVSVGSCDTNGAFGYLTSYCTSSISDREEGFIAFHRQSLGIGSELYKRFSQVLYELQPVSVPLDPLNSKYGVVPIPAYYRKKFANDDARIVRNLLIIPSLTEKYDRLYLNIESSEEDIFVKLLNQFELAYG